MREGWFGLGWFVRRTADAARLAAFYQQVVGLPLLRQNDGASFWIGETVVFEVATGGQPTPRYRDRSEAPCVPVFRVTALARVVERLRAAGAELLHEPFERPHSWFAYLRDPAGEITGFAERRRTSPYLEDQEAWRRWDRGRLTVPGIPPLPPHFQSLGWVVVRCADVEAVGRFYREVVGLTLLRTTATSQVFDLGDLALLEVAAGGIAQPTPADRTAVSNAFLFRVDDADRQAAALVAAGARLINPPFSVPGGRVAYFVDPEGHLFGLQSRLPDSPRPEDREAFARLSRAGHR
jgi:predicted enzyme related to lactoylglutathione lyase